MPEPPLPGQVQLWLASLDRPPLPSATLHGLLDAAECEGAARFRLEQHRLRYAHGRGLLRCLLGHALGIAAAQVRFGIGAQGKPRLAAAHDAASLDFNLSHSGGWALVGLSDGAAIGVDIEVPRAVPEFGAIVQRSFAPAEREELLGLPPSRHMDAFLAGWTRKEAFVKLLGSGLSVPLDGFDVSINPDAPARLGRVSDPSHPPSDFTLWAGRTPQACCWAAIVRRSNASVQTYSLS